MIHLSTSKQLARFERVWPPPFTGDRRPRAPPRCRLTKKVHVANRTDATGLWLTSQVLAGRAEGRQTVFGLPGPCRRMRFLNRDQPVAGFFISWNISSLSDKRHPPIARDDCRRKSPVAALDSETHPHQALHPQTNEQGRTVHQKPFLSEWAYVDRLPNIG